MILSFHLVLVVLREEGDQSIDYLPKSTHAKTKSTGGIQMCFLVSISICRYLLKQRGFNLKMKKSKSKRSVGDPRESRYVFWTKGGQLGTPVTHITFLD